MSSVEDKKSATPVNQPPAQPTGAVAIARTAEVVSSVLGSRSLQSLNNFVGDQMAQWRCVAIATGPSIKPADEVIGKAFGVSYFHAHKVELFNPQTGQINEVTRVVLMDSKFEGYAFLSEGIANDLGGIISCFGMGPWTPPLQIKIVEVKTRAGFKVYRIQPAI